MSEVSHIEWGDNNCVTDMPALFPQDSFLKRTGFHVLDPNSVHFGTRTEVLGRHLQHFWGGGGFFAIPS
jgi:hypothetical protein